jgi:hypothetical protein
LRRLLAGKGGVFPVKKLLNNFSEKNLVATISGGITLALPHRMG